LIVLCVFLVVRFSLRSPSFFSASRSVIPGREMNGDQTFFFFPKIFVVFL